MFVPCLRKKKTPFFFLLDNMSLSLHLPDWPARYSHTVLVEHMITLGEGSPVATGSLSQPNRNPSCFPRTVVFGSSSDGRETGSQVPFCDGCFLSLSPAQRETCCTVRLGWKGEKDIDTHAHTLTHAHAQKVQRHSQHVVLERSQNVWGEFNLIQIM